MFFYMKNDLVICLIKVPLGILLEAMAAFAITRLRVRNRTSVFIFFLIGMMLPMQVALIPISIVFGKLGLFNTYIGLGVVYIGFGISFGILVLRGFMSGIPHELDEAAIHRRLQQGAALHARHTAAVQACYRHIVH